MRTAIEVKELLGRDQERYRNQQEELDNVYSDTVIQLKKARVTIVVWARAHRNLSQGVTDPARIDLFDITKKAMQTVM